MPNIPTGGAEMPRATMDTTVPRLEPVVRAPPLITENKASQQAEKAKVDEDKERQSRESKQEDRRKEERRTKKEAVLLDQRQGGNRREHRAQDALTLDASAAKEKSGTRLGQHINIKV